MDTPRLVRLVLTWSIAASGCSAGYRGTTTAAPDDPCRGDVIELADAYAHCMSASDPGPAPDDSALELSVPASVSVTSGGRAQIVVELRNRSETMQRVAFLPSDLSVIIVAADRRVDAMCALEAGASKEVAAREPSALVIELVPSGVLRLPMQVTAWASLVGSRDADCMHGDEQARGPLPPGHYEARLTLPWGRTRTVALEITPRTASLGAEWPRGETRLACTRDEDCTVVAGPCAAQAVNAAFATETLRLHEALAEHGACTPSPAPTAPARCDDTFCAL